MNRGLLDLRPVHDLGQIVESPGKQVLGIDGRRRGAGFGSRNSRRVVFVMGDGVWR